jgi:serine phosphatase RsbU (regulator of sigma subunit)
MEVLTPAPRRWWALHAGTVIVLVIGLLLTVSISVGTRLLRNDNEDRLLHQRVNEAATVIASSVNSTHAPLLAAAALAETTDGDPDAFKRMLEPIVATKVPDTSASLWRTDMPTLHPEVVIGTAPKLATEPPERIRAVIDQAARSKTLTIVDLLDDDDRRLGYANSISGPDESFVVYGEAQLPRNRRARVARNSAFADFDYALYLGTRPDPDHLLASSNAGGIAAGRRQGSMVVPYGDKKILLVAAPTTELGGTVLLRLPWALAAVGLFFTLAVAALVERLIRRRKYAEDLAAELERIAAENARLLADQRSVAYELQHSLLPEALPDVAGLDLGVRYLAGVEGVDIGGDWYDVLNIDGRLLVVMGDVSGRGIRAATIMASLRYAIHAYAAQGDVPEVILSKLSKLLHVERDGGFATVLCATVDVGRHEVTIASAGHLPPLLLAPGSAEFVAIKTGVPVGVDGGNAYTSVTIKVPPNATLLAYTDGLIERRGESLDVGFARLREAARRVDGSLEALLTQLVDELTGADSDDDTAVLGLRWTS